MHKFNNVIVGILIGICVPVVGYALILIVFEQLTAAGLMDDITMGSSRKRMRTLSLLGICCNIIPFEIFRRKYYDNTLRGMVFPTLGYMLYWVYFFYADLFLAS